MTQTNPANEQRIAQFRKMANDDPQNELAHLSLGRELLAAGEAGEAVECFRRTLELNEKLSKAYQLLGEGLLKLGRKQDAIVVMQRGAQVAAERGDMMVKDALVKQLQDLGAQVPELGPAKQVEVGEGQVLDVRTGEVGSRLPRPPVRGVLGKVIYDNVSAESWQEWIGMGTKVINELRLPLADPKAQELYDQHMIDFLNLREVYEQAKKDQPAGK